ncbi:hypothetical protein AOQ84DRAFT_378100 [Glonium stellatum]|uniref:Myb-like domain-containing protein n=1 Tax=Glonium stellatum TaxID=574774 RepID=A0A8E2JRI9_9PEZI|nr:hypothetical protein AOQ84DRAFT_378100 [Glonium stellatum]
MKIRMLINGYSLDIRHIIDPLPLVALTPTSLPSTPHVTNSKLSTNSVPQISGSSVPPHPIHLELDIQQTHALIRNTTSSSYNNSKPPTDAHVAFSPPLTNSKPFTNTSSHSRLSRKKRGANLLDVRSSKRRKGNPQEKAAKPPPDTNVIEYRDYYQRECSPSPLPVLSNCGIPAGSNKSSISSAERSLSLSPIFSDPRVPDNSSKSSVTSNERSPSPLSIFSDPGIPANSNESSTTSNNRSSIIATNQSSIALINWPGIARDKCYRERVKQWTKEEDDLLKSLRDNLMTFPQIANLIKGRTQFACENRAIFLRKNGRKESKKQWTEEEDNRLISLRRETTSSGWIAGHFKGRTKAACEARFQYLKKGELGNIQVASRKRWTKEEDERLISLRDDAMPFDQIAKLLKGRNSKRCEIRHRYLQGDASKNQGPKKRVVQRWKNSEEKRLLELFSSGTGWDSFKDEFSGRSKSACMKKYYDLIQIESPGKRHTGRFQTLKNSWI